MFEMQYISCFHGRNTSFPAQLLDTEDAGTLISYDFRPQGSFRLKEIGQVLDTLLGKSFRAAKCKSLLSQAILHSKQLRRQRKIKCKTLRKDVAKLLQSDLETNALLKVEDLFKEQNMIDAYVLIERFCTDVISKAVAIEKQKDCPTDLKEAIQSLCFAAQKCADLHELQQIRCLFSAKYGRHFTTTLPGVHPDCGVSQEITEKLSPSKPSGHMQLTLMKEIANENSIEWKIENLLDGPDCFVERKKIDLSSRPPSIGSTVLENTKDTNELEKKPMLLQSFVKELALGIRSPPLLPPFPSTEKIKKSTVRSIRSEELDSSKQEQSSSLWLEGKSIGNKDKNSWNSNGYYQDSLTANDCCNSARFSRDEGFYLGYSEEKIKYKDVATPALTANDFYNSASFSRDEGFYLGNNEEKIMYKDVAIAAQAALKSARHAAAAAQAALYLAKSKYNQISSQTTEDSSEITSDSSDVDDETDETFEKTFLRDRNEVRRSKHCQCFGRDIRNKISLHSGVSKRSKQRRDAYDDSDDKYESVSYDSSFRKKEQVRQGRTESCLNKPVFWVKPNSNNQLSSSNFYDKVEHFPVASSRCSSMFPHSEVNHRQNCLCDDESDKHISFLDKRQYQNPRRATNRSASEIRVRPRMKLEDKGKLQRSQSSRLDGVIKSDGFQRINFRSKTPIPWRSTSMDFDADDDFSGGIRNKFIVSQNSDKGGLYRGGKLRWCSSNLQDQKGQCVSLGERESKNSYSFSKLGPVKDDGKFYDGFNHGNRSDLTGVCSTDLKMVNGIVHGHQEKAKEPSSKTVVDSLETSHTGLETSMKNALELI